MTENEKAIINSDRTTKYVRYEFPDLDIEDITAERIYQESMSLEESIFDGDSLKFGMCNGSLFKTRVANSLDDIDDARMNVYIHYTNDELGELDLEFGKYIVVNTERTSDRRWRDITATDYMTLFDVDVSDWYINTMFIDEDAVYSLKEFREALCDYIGVDYEDVSLPSDGVMIKKTVTPQTLSGRELLEMICELNCCFGHFDWSGVLRFITLSVTDDTEIIDRYPQDGCQYEDYDIEKFNTIVIQNAEGDDAIVYKHTEDPENRYVVSNNIFVYDMVAAELEIVAGNILYTIRDFTYRINTTKVFGHVYMPLGQRYEVVTKTYDGTEEVDTTFQSFVLKRTIEGIQAMFSTLEATGERYSSNARDISTEIASLRSKNEVIRREIDALTGRIGIYLLYDNEDPYLIEDSETIIDIPFFTNKKSYIVFHASVIFSINTLSEEIQEIMNFNDGEVTFQFVLNDLAIPDYTPKVTYQDGTYTIHLDYSWFNEIVDETLDQNFHVLCTVGDCTVTIPTYRIHGYLTGDGLFIGSAWDGRLYANDEFGLLGYAMNDLVSDEANVTTQLPIPATPSDRVGLLGYIDSTGITSDSVSSMIGMIFTTVVNLSLLTYTATITNNTFTNGEVITPAMYDVEQIKVTSNGVAYYVSVDGGITWSAYVDGQWVEGASMTASELESVPTSALQGRIIKVRAVIDSQSSLTIINVKGGRI